MSWLQNPLFFYPFGALVCCVLVVAVGALEKKGRPKSEA